MKNSEIINTPDSLLTELDRQRKYLLKMWVVKQPCPNCSTLMDYFDGKGTTIDDYKFGSDDYNDDARCIKCERDLKYVVPFVAVGGPGWHWALVPIELGEEK